MAWKNIQQRNLADILAVEHKAITELDDAHNLIDRSRIEKLLQRIHNKNVVSSHGHRTLAWREMVCVLV